MKEKIKIYLNRILEDSNNSFPELVLDFWVDNYGAKVNKLIIDKNDKEWIIDQILTVDNQNEISPWPLSWRNNLNAEALDYSAPYLESVLSNWEEHDKLIPIAGINSHDTANYDILVINFLEDHNPKVSIWVHEESFGYEEPFLIDVVDGFEIFQTEWN